MENGKSDYTTNTWLDIFANFRNGAELTEIIKAEEPFIRTPHWLSPLHQENYRRYRSFEIPGIQNDGRFPAAVACPVWDGVCKDEVARKFLFVQAADRPAALTGAKEDISAEEKAAMEKAYKMLNLNGDPESWYREYYPLASALTHVTLLSDPMAGCLERGYRSELIILNLIGNYLGTATTKAEWSAFYEEMGLKMFGERGIPYVIFTVDFQV